MNHPDFALRRQAMVREQVVGRGVVEPRVVEALHAVPREAFLAPELHEFAYEEVSLPQPPGRVLPQPYVLAVALAALALQPHERVLEIGTGCGWSSAVLARLAREVYTLEPDPRIAEQVAERLSRLGERRVHVMHAEDATGWAAQAPFDAILVHPGHEVAADALREQLARGGRMVLPAQASSRALEWVRVRRVSELRYEREDIADMRIAPLFGGSSIDTVGARASTTLADDARLSASLLAHGEVFDDLDGADLEPLLRRIGQARVVLIGEASHGSSEFYRMRQRITRALIERGGFDFVAIEGDWPDCARIDHYVRHAEAPSQPWRAFARFPAWMWRNREVAEFVDWLHGFNAELPPARRIGVHGLDLYSMYSSIERVLEYLERIDPDTARVARQRYACLEPWQDDPAGYAHAALTAHYRSCESEVVDMLRELLHGRAQGSGPDGAYLDALQNARLVANAERYYRTMYYGSRASWNLRDGHMFETLRSLLDYHGPHSRAVVWAHNSHIGDSAATEMALRGEFNLGRLCRKAFGAHAFAIGMGTHAGSVAAASHWGGDMQVMPLRASAPRSHERVFHESGAPAMLLSLRAPALSGALAGLQQARLQRAVGVIYRPASEMASHYFEAVLPHQYDEYLWIDRTEAVHPLDAAQLEGLPQTYPFGV